ncbi:MAG: pilus assembly protein [Alphaproteobacteria bacterium]|nr:MAG: pilus assembly protein [Alphaproteobacteria bacterium]
MRIMHPRCCLRLPSIWRRQDGIAAVEFSFAAPVLLAVMIGAFEIGNFMFAKVVLEGAAREAARQGITGYAPCGMTREEFIQATIDRAMLGFSDPDRREITKRVYQSFTDIGEPEDYDDVNGNGAYDTGEPFTDVNGNNQWDPDMAAAGLGGPGDVVVYDFSYELDSMTGFFSHIVPSASRLKLTASTAVRNEPASIDPLNAGTCTI